jgi:hypothetical protein
VSTALLLAVGIGIIEAVALYLGSGKFLGLMGISSVSFWIYLDLHSSFINCSLLPFLSLYICIHVCAYLYMKTHAHQYMLSLSFSLSLSSYIYMFKYALVIMDFCVYYVYFPTLSGIVHLDFKSSIGIVLYFLVDLSFCFLR